MAVDTNDLIRHLEIAKAANVKEALAISTAARTVSLDRLHDSMSKVDGSVTDLKAVVERLVSSSRWMAAASWALVGLTIVLAISDLQIGKVIPWSLLRSATVDVRNGDGAVSTRAMVTGSDFPGQALAPARGSAAPGARTLGSVRTCRSNARPRPPSPPAPSRPGRPRSSSSAPCFIELVDARSLLEELLDARRRSLPKRSESSFGCCSARFLAAAVPQRPSFPGFLRRRSRVFGLTLVSTSWRNRAGRPGRGWWQAGDGGGVGHSVPGAETDPLECCQEPVRGARRRPSRAGCRCPVVGLRFSGLEAEVEAVGTYPARAGFAVIGSDHSGRGPAPARGSGAPAARTRAAPGPVVRVPTTFVF